MLLIPGPVDVPEAVLKASAYVQNHRSEEFRNIVRRSQELLNTLSGSRHALMTTGSGTTAVESIIYSMISPKEEVLAVTFGEFGNRMVESLQRRGAVPAVLKKSHGEYLEKGEISDICRKNRNLKSVFLVQNETGNGTSIHNLRELAQEAGELGLKVFVDSVSGLGGMEIKADSWGIHAFASCSQKGLASVPGLGIVCIGEEGEKYVRDSRDVPAYMDLRTSLKFMAKFETPYTPSTGSFRALLAALLILQREGHENRWKRHQAAAGFVRASLEKSGLELYGNEKNFSDTVVAFRPSMPGSQLAGELSKRNIIVSRGMGTGADEMIRVGLLGVVDNIKIASFLNELWKIMGRDESVDADSLPSETRIDEDIYNITFD